MRHACRAARYLASVLLWSVRLGRAARLRIGRWCSGCLTRVLHDQGYAEAFAAVVLAATELLVDSARVRYLVQEAAALVVAVLRAMRLRAIGDVLA